MVKNIANSKSFIGFVVLYFAWIAIFSVWTHQNEKDFIYKQLDKELVSAAMAVPLLLPENFHHKNMVHHQVSEKTDDANVAKLSNFTRESNIIYVYSMIKEGDAILFTSTSATDDELAEKDYPRYLEAYDDVDPRAHEIIASGKQMFLEFEDQWGHFRSVFIPLKSEDGRWYLVAADIEVSHISDLLQAEVGKTLFIATLFVLIGIPLLLAYTKSVRRFAQQLDHRVIERTKELSSSENRLNTILEQSPVGIVHYDQNMIVKTFNQRFANYTGSLQRGLIGQALDDCFQSKELLQAVRNSLSGQKGVYEGHLLDHGKDIEVQVEFAPMYAENNQVIGGIGVFNDVSQLKQVESDLKLSAQVFSDSHEGIIITDEKLNITDTNPAFFDITGIPRDDIINRRWSLLGLDSESKVSFEDILQAVKEFDFWQGEIWMRKASGQKYAIFLTVSVLKDKNEKITHYVGTFSDITRAKRQQEQMEFMAHYDVLTGLPNRTLFADRFKLAIAHSERSGQKLAVVFLDLDNFKPINDQFGHETGDEILVEVAQRLSSTIRNEDTVSRLGGDEFTLLLNDIESVEQCKLAIERLHNSISQPINIDDKLHYLSVSTGFTLYPDDAGDIDTLLRHADQAMYQAKLAGKDRMALFNPDQDIQAIKKHHQLEEIERALQHNEFELFYQPKVNMKTGTVYGAEALIRWIHPEKGLIPPLDFLPVLDGTELEIKVGNWVVSQALSQIEQWSKKGIQFEVSVNIASHHIQSSRFFEDIEMALAKNPGVSPAQLQLEVLESSILSDLASISRIISRCQEELGINIALDDFGTGYSSLAHLRNLPADTIKIDQSFVIDMLDDPEDLVITDAVIGLADSFSRDVIAEGVETTEHGLALMVMGCEKAQGYGIAKPMPADQFDRWYQDYLPNENWKNFDREALNAKQGRRHLLSLTVQQWKNRLSAAVSALPEHDKPWPIMNIHQCHCGAWLKQASKEGLFEKDEIQHISEAHEKLHHVANHLQSECRKGEHQKAQSELEQLDQAYHQLMETIQAIHTH